MSLSYKIPLSKPDISRSEQKAVADVLKTSVLSLGQNYIKFQDTMAQFAHVKYGVAVNSGTSGLHLIVRALGIGKGDEVITTPFSFIASANCILYEGARPVFADIDPLTLCIDPAKIEEKITGRTKAILAVDVFSHPAYWKELQKIAKKHNLFLIEDSAEALGSEYFGKPCGSFGNASIFAFYPNKQITTGEGGMILTNNKKIADFCVSSANQGRKNKSGKWLEHEILGYNYRLDEMSCALGIAQLSRIKEIIKKRQKVAGLYNRQINKEIPQIEIPYVAKDCQLSWFVYVVRLPESLAGIKRNKIILKMARKGIQCSNYFQPIHLQPFYAKEFGYKQGDFPVAENISRRTLALPFYSNISEDQINFVVKELRDAIC